MLAAASSEAAANSFERFTSSVAMTPVCARWAEKCIGRKSDLWSCLRVTVREVHAFPRTRALQTSVRAEDGARSLAQWVTAVASLKGNGPMELEGAIGLIHA